MAHDAAGGHVRVRSANRSRQVTFLQTHFILSYSVIKMKLFSNTLPTKTSFFLFFSFVIQIGYILILPRYMKAPHAIHRMGRLVNF